MDAASSACFDKRATAHRSARTADLEAWRTPQAHHRAVRLPKARFESPRSLHARETRCLQQASAEAGAIQALERKDESRLWQNFESVETAGTRVAAQWDPASLDRAARSRSSRSRAQATR